MENPKYFAPSVDAAARVLQFLSRYESKKSTLTEISSALDINKSTCMRVLKTLEMHNLVYYDTENLKYSLGVLTAVLGSRASETLDYLVYIKPYLKEAAEKTGLTAGFVQRISTNRLMIVDKHEGSRQPQLILSVGNKFPITDVSYGKWLLAYLEEEEREEILSQGLRKVTEFTNTDVNDYRKELENIKRDRVLVSIDEYYIGTCAISCPIFIGPNKLLGVITLLAWTSTITEAEIEEIKTVLIDICNRCARKLSGDLLLHE